MAVLKCKMCGGTLNASENVNVCICEYCGTAQTITKSRDEINANLFNRANNLRFNRDFDKAQEIYERIVQDNPDDSEAYWGLVLCKYGIEYVTDPATGKKLPTCHRTLPESVLADMDYKSAVSYAEQARRNLYVSEAEEIDRIQRRILEIARSEEPFDVFICYKQTDENGKRTPDSVIANDIYYQLKQAGIKAFYAAITLEDKLGHEYEPYIYAALSSAKVMLVVGTKPEYFQSVWLKNEWGRFLKFMKTDRNRLLIPCYKDMDAYDLPEEFAHLQAQDMSRIGFINDVIHGVQKTISREAENKRDAHEISRSRSHENNDTDDHTMMQRMSSYFNVRDFSGAIEYCDRLLDRNPDWAKVYFYRFLAEHFCVDVQEIYSRSKIEFLADSYMRGYGYDTKDEDAFRSKVQYVLKHSIKNAIDFARGAEREEYVHVYEGLVNLIRGEVAERESIQAAYEMRMAQAAENRRKEEERAIKRATRKKRIFKMLALLSFLLFLSSVLADAASPFFFFLIIIFLILGSGNTKKQK